LAGKKFLGNVTEVGTNW